jgi:hypothetical protein
MRPEDLGFEKKRDRGNRGFVYEKQTPDFDANPRLTADRYDSEEWLVKLELPDPTGGRKEFGSRSAWSRGGAESKMRELLRQYRREVDL